MVGRSFSSCKSLLFEMGEKVGPAQRASRPVEGPARLVFVEDSVDSRMQLVLMLNNETAYEDLAYCCYCSCLQRVSFHVYAPLVFRHGWLEQICVFPLVFPDGRKATSASFLPLYFHTIPEHDLPWPSVPFPKSAA